MHDDLLARRDDYPILSRSTYLISNSLGAMHRETRKRLQDYADLWDTEGVVAWKSWFPEMTHVANLVGATIGAAPGTTVLRQSVADAIVAVASCFDLRERRNRVVTTAADWPGTHYFWTEHCARFGGELAVVGYDPDGRTIDADKVAAAIDGTTLLVSVSLVQFRTSALLDLAPIVDAAHRHGALVLLDAYQGAGTVPLDVVAEQVDFCVGGSVKFLCGGPGDRWHSLRPDLAQELLPADVRGDSHAKPLEVELADRLYAPGG